mmetsp:Transcript_9227/g.20591  ORF Transcript_9227/g.20591 Transcript_9227/m.20591 type:complete len:449 (-) Transcript_9227:8-1354(-)
MAPARSVAAKTLSSARPLLLLESMVEPPAERRIQKLGGGGVPQQQLPTQLQLRTLLADELQHKRSACIPKAGDEEISRPSANALHDVKQHQHLSAADDAQAVAADATALRKDFHPYHSQAVPKPENLQAKGPTRPNSPTAMMLRNIPNKYSQNSLMQEINDCGFKGTYNFFYLPMDVHNRSNVGYAFINFEEPEDAEQFRQQFAEHRFARYHSHKIGTVSVAHVQGLHANLRHFENRAVTQARNDQYRPVVLRGEKRLDFDAALAEARAVDVVATPRAAVAPHNVMSPPATPPPGLERPCDTVPFAQVMHTNRTQTGVHGARLSLEAAIVDLLASEEAEMTKRVSKQSVASYDSTASPVSSPEPHVIDLSQTSDGAGSEGYSSGAGETSMELSSCAGGGQSPIDADIAHLQWLKMMLGESLSEKSRGRSTAKAMAQSPSYHLFPYLRS